MHCSMKRLIVQFILMLLFFGLGSSFVHGHDEGGEGSHHVLDYPIYDDAKPYPAPVSAGEGRFWWRGNLHTHTLWSDGDQFPEVVTQWYVANGYHFLALSDHNVLLRGEKWINPRTNRYLVRAGGMDAVELYQERFGEEWVETRGIGEDLEVRLKTLEEFRSLFEKDDRFLLIESEEITAGSIHVNAANILELIRPQTGGTVEETIRLNIDAVVAQSEEYEKAMMPHLNHPNFQWAVRAEDMAPVENLRFFEVYNGHRGVNNYGDALHPDLERIWDIVLTKRLAELDLGIVYGLAVDDAHNYEDSTSEASRPGRGWVMVRAESLDAESLITAMESGDFYASTGVTVRSVVVSDAAYEINIEPEEGVIYTTEFIGTREGYDAVSEPVMRSVRAGKIGDIAGRWIFVQAVADREEGLQTLRVYDPEKDEWHEAGIELPAGETNPTGSLYIPSHPSGDPFNGQMAELRYWHRGRTKAEAVVDAGKGLTGKEEGLVAYWKMDDAGDGVVRDHVGGHDGEIVGGRIVEAADRLERRALETDGSEGFVVVENAEALVPAGRSFTIEMWVRTDGEAARGWNLPMEWPGGDRIYVGHQVGSGWNFVVTTDGVRTDTHLGEQARKVDESITRIYSDDIGEVFHTVEGVAARYAFEGDEIYVRARVISSRLHSNPFARGEKEMAWLQPVVPPAAEEGGGGAFLLQGRGGYVSNPTPAKEKVMEVGEGVGWEGDANIEVADYELPDVMTSVRGEKIQTSGQWLGVRRPEVLELFREHVYGRLAGRPDELKFELMEEDIEAMGGEAILRRVAVQSRVGGRDHVFELIIFIPKVRTEPVPLFLLINNRDRDNIDYTRGTKSDFWPVEEVIGRGYAIAAFQHNELAPDFADTFTQGVIDLFEGGERPRADDAWGALAAWGWGASRAMDYFESDEAIDASKVALVGHSRGGKASLWAGAEDERFALVISNNSGCGGAALSRRRVGERVAQINSRFPHWFCKNFTKYDNNEDDLPVDQHMLIALIAPRAVYIASADEDIWADPRGEYLSLVHASSVYGLWGHEIFEGDAMPVLERPVQVGPMGYHIRGGKHDLTKFDWRCFMDFAGLQWE